MDNNELVTAWIDYRIDSGPVLGPLGKQVGLRMTIKAKPEVEDLMRATANNRTVGIDAFGDLWLPVNLEADKPLDVYAIEIPNGHGYTLNSPAQPLLIEQRQTRNALVADDDEAISKRTANLSFLTLVGISKPGGVTFGISGMYSADYIKTLHNILPVRLKRFLQDYVVPVTVNLQIISRV